MINLLINEFNNLYEEDWDIFIKEKAVNGSFLQSRTFLNYHPKDRFKDNSLLVLKDKETIMAVIPACEIKDKGEGKIFYSHKGSTFGGIIISEKYYKVNYIDSIIKKLDNYLNEKNFDTVYLKQLPNIFSKILVDKLDYLLKYNNYKSYEELNIVVDLKMINDILMDFTKTTRKNCRRGKNFLIFKEIRSKEELLLFYRLLCKNLEKYGIKPIHTFEEILDLQKRLKDNIKFYGAFKNDIMIGANMSFLFNNRVFHTQNTSIDYKYSNFRPADFINYNLIKLSKKLGFCYYSFGICTENKGKELNFSLASFKEGFCGLGSLNKTYYKSLRGN